MWGKDQTQCIMRINCTSSLSMGNSRTARFSTSDQSLRSHHGFYYVIFKTSAGSTYLLFSLIIFNWASVYLTVVDLKPPELWASSRRDWFTLLVYWLSNACETCIHNSDALSSGLASKGPCWRPTSRLYVHVCHGLLIAPKSQNVAKFLTFFTSGRHFANHGQTLFTW